MYPLLYVQCSYWIYSFEKTTNVHWNLGRSEFSAYLYELLGVRFLLRHSVYAVFMRGHVGGFWHWWLCSYVCICATYIKCVFLKLVFFQINNRRSQPVYEGTPLWSVQVFRRAECAKHPKVASPTFIRLKNSAHINFNAASVFNSINIQQKHHNKFLVCNVSLVITAIRALLPQQTFNNISVTNIHEGLASYSMRF